MTEERLFELALQTPSAEQPALLDRECAGDPALRARVEALLSADANPDLTIDQPRGISESSHASVGTVGSMIAGKYKLIEAIGEGGMGSVWLAQQTEPVKRKVAVKLIKAGMDSKAVLARFDAERQALAMMDHPNIAKVLDGGLHDGRPFFVMELVKGLPITEYCDAQKLTPKERLELFVPVCQAIQHAHQKGIIHRDIKPSNVLVALYDDKPVPKVIDFGLAKATGASLTDLSINTAFGGVVGTPQYMSPEQASLNNLDIDTRSDVYSLGILLYELLAGNPPFRKQEFEKAGMLEILRMVREEEPPKPSTKLSTAEALPSLSANRGTEPKKLTALLRSELDWIVLKALEKDRTRRYESANGFAADVQRYLSGEAVQAHPPSIWYRYVKFSRRNRNAIFASYFFLGCLVAFVSSLYSQVVRARTAERDAIAERIKAEEALLKVNSERENAKRAAEFFWDEAVSLTSPYREADRNIKLQTVVDRMEARVVSGQAGLPRLVEAYVRRRFGDLFQAQYEDLKAEGHFVWALTAQREELGADHPDTMETESYLHITRAMLGRNDDALAGLREVLTRQVRIIGRDDERTMWTQNHVGWVLCKLGRRDEAWEPLRTSTAWFASRGTLSHKWHSGVANLAMECAFHGDAAEADKLARLMVVRGQAAGTLGGAAVLYGREVAALVRFRANDLEVAAKELEAVEREMSERFGRGHVETVQCREMLIEVLQRRRDFQTAAPHIQTLLEFEYDTTDPDWEPYLFFPVYDAYNRAFLPDPDTAKIESDFRAAIAKIEQHPTRATTGFHLQARSMYGEFLVGRKRYEDAERELVGAYSGLVKSGTPSGYEFGYIPVAGDRVVNLYREWGKTAEAEKWRRLVDADNARQVKKSP